MIQRWSVIDKTTLSPGERSLALDAYDECVADLDEQLGVLFDELKRRGILENTWLIVVADHGESFGEHEGIWCHGLSVYQSEVHVPLLIIPPGGTTKQVVKKSVSVRELAATVADVLQLATDSPFPGDSLARFWKNKPPTGSSAGGGLAEVVPLDPASGTASRPNVTVWPIGGLADDGWSYIRREGQVHEELYNLRADPKEQKNLVADPSASGVLDRMRVRLQNLTNGPLTPDRFKP